MRTAFHITLRSGRLLLTIYGIGLALALPSALAMFGTLRRETGASLAPLRMLDGFDYTVYSDFMHESGRAVMPLLGAGRWTAMLYVVVSLFLAGGVLAHHAQFSSANRATTFRADVGTSTLFWAACRHYVGRFVRLFGVTLLFAGLLFGIPALLGVVGIVALEDALTERGLFWVGVAGVAVGLALGTLALCTGDVAKVLMVRHDERRAFRAFGQAGRLVLRYPKRLFGPYWLLIGVGTALFGLYFGIDALITMRNWPTILLMLVVQQAFIFSRVFLKVWWLGTAYTLVGALSATPLPATRPTDVVADGPERGGPIHETPANVVTDERQRSETADDQPESATTLPHVTNDNVVATDPTVGVPPQRSEPAAHDPHRSEAPRPEVPPPAGNPLRTDPNS